MMRSAARAYRLAVFTKNWTNPAYAGARLAADRLARRHGWRLTHFVPTRPDDVAEQRALLETALAERPDANLLAPTHATALNDVLSANATAPRAGGFRAAAAARAGICIVGSRSGDFQFD